SRTTNPSLTVHGHSRNTRFAISAMSSRLTRCQDVLAVNQSRILPGWYCRISASGSGGMAGANSELLLLASRRRYQRAYSLSELPLKVAWDIVMFAFFAARAARQSPARRRAVFPAPSPHSGPRWRFQPGRRSEAAW